MNSDDMVSVVLSLRTDGVVIIRGDLGYINKELRVWQIVGLQGEQKHDEDDEVAPLTVDVPSADIAAESINFSRNA